MRHHRSSPQTVRTDRPFRTTQHGFSLIELMVAMVIGLFVTLAITGVMIRSEGNKRTNTTVNDVNQTGSYIAYALDRALRSAGSGFTQIGSGNYGCTLNVSKDGSPLLPSTAALPTPFGSLSSNVVLAPVLIGSGKSSGGSDTIQVMAGNAGFGEAPTRVTAGSVTGSSLGLPNTLSYNAGDLVMLVEPPLGCMIQQVASGFAGTPSTFPNTAAPTTVLPLGGSYASTANLTSYGITGNAFLVGLGNVVNPSQLQVFGVGQNNTLFSYDYLQLTSSVSVPVADGVVEMRALYGVDTNNDGVLDNWVAPTGTTYGIDALNQVAGAATIKTIVAVRLGLILRTSLQERDIVSPGNVTLFSDLGAPLTYTRTLTTAERYFRFRTVEETIPLRNVKYGS